MLFHQCPKWNEFSISFAVREVRKEVEIDSGPFTPVER
jgi:hypothetical protein